MSYRAGSSVGRRREPNRILAKAPKPDSAVNGLNGKSLSCNTLHASVTD
jgi:hypothetical protein